MSRKYNYVIFGSGNDYYLCAYHDLMNCDDVRYNYKPIDCDNKLLTDLYRAHTSPKTNNWIKLPFKRIWNPMMFRKKFKNDKPICFLFFAGKGRLINNGLVDYLKGNYLGSKFVVFYQDLVGRNKDVSLNWYKDNFDLLLSFDPIEAKKYELIYYHDVYSKIDIDLDDNEKYQSDIYFLGMAKDRLPAIISAFEILTEYKLNCKFFVSGVEPKEQKYKDKICYCNYISYLENLKYVKGTRCILELLQGGAHGFTLRTCEAVTYGKKLLTNNTEIMKAPFYREDYIYYFSDAKNIRSDFFSEPLDVINYHYMEQLSPCKLLDYIDERL